MFGLKKKIEEKKAQEETGKVDTKQLSPMELILRKDLAKLDFKESLVELIFPSPDDLRSFEVVLKPDTGIWQGGKFKFLFEIPVDYNISPPKVRCATRLLHPNIDPKGGVCLNILRDDWTPSLDLNAVILGLLFLFYDPNPHDPLDHEAAELMKADRVAFERKARALISEPHFSQISIAVGTKNPAKIRAVEEAGKALFGDVVVHSVDVSSGVNAQPMTDDETITGAMNRAVAAQKATGAVYGVGVEGGIQRTFGKYFECTWVVVVHQDGRVGTGSSGRFEVSEKIAKMIEGGMELGDVMDQLSGLKNVGYGQGAMGLLTKGCVARDAASAHGVYFAFAPFVSDPKFWE